MSADSPFVAPGKNIFYGLAVGVLLGGSLGLLIAIGIWAGRGIKLPSTIPAVRIQLPILSNAKFELSQTRQWINCGGVRSGLIEEADRLYLACDGGILVISPSGEVLDQFSMADGLKNNFINSLVKIGDSLYAGTQDGFSIINLTDRSIKNISVAEGLANGSNVRLARDGDFIWIGTFDGIARYDTRSGEIKNYHEELRSIGSQLSASGVYVTPRGIYFTFSAHDRSNGGLARYDKATGEFEIIARSKFGSMTRLDINDLVSYDGVVLVSDWSNLWIAEDKPGADWIAHLEIQDKIKNLTGISDYPTVRAVGFKDGMPLVFSQNLLFGYDLGTRELKVLYPERWQGEAVNVLSGLQPDVVSPAVIWLNKGPGLNLVRFDLADFGARSIALRGRPASFNQILAVINDQPVFLGNFDEVWQLGAAGFEKLLAGVGGVGIDSGFGGAAFEPIAGTSKVLVYFQTCGQGCGKPQATLFDYQEKSLKPIELSRETLEKLSPDPSNDFGFGQMVFIGFANGQAMFQISGGPEAPSKVTYNYATNQWLVAPLTASETQVSPESTRCNPVYSFTDGRFVLQECLKQTDRYRFVIENAGGRSALRRIDLTTSEPTVLEPQLAEKRYSPFSTEFYIPSFSFGIIAEGKFWLATNLGLPVYDPVSDGWQLFDTRSGLPTNEILSFAVGPQAIWAITENGGLAGIKRGQ